MKKIKIVVLMLVFVLVISCGAFAEEESSFKLKSTGGIVGGFIGGNVVVDFNEAENIYLGAGIVKIKDLESLSLEKKTGLQILAGKHWDKVNFGGEVSDDFNYAVGVSINTVDGVGIFCETGYKLSDEFSAGLFVDIKSGMAITVDYTF